MKQMFQNYFQCNVFSTIFKTLNNLYDGLKATWEVWRNKMQHEICGGVPGRPDW